MKPRVLLASSECIDEFNKLDKSTFTRVITTFEHDDVTVVKHDQLSDCDLINSLAKKSSPAIDRVVLAKSNVVVDDDDLCKLKSWSTNDAPPRSHLGLLQEDVWPNEWLMFATCILLNCTKRSQLETIFPKFLNDYHCYQNVIKCDYQKLKNMISPLGFKNRRTEALIKMSKAYESDSWKKASDLPGIGVYGERSWLIFFKNELSDHAPKDGALVKYWNWRKNEND